MHVVGFFGLVAGASLLSLVISGCPQDPKPGPAQALVLLRAGDAAKQVGGPILSEDIDRFDVAITGIRATTGEFNGAEEVVFSGRAVVNLADLDVVSAVITRAELPAGRYRKIRIAMSDPRLVLNSAPETVITDVSLGENNTIEINQAFDILRDHTSVLRLDLREIELNTTSAGHYVLETRARAEVVAGPAPAVAMGDISTLDQEAMELSVDVGGGDVAVNFTGDTLISFPQNPVETYYDASELSGFLMEGQPVSVRGTATSDGILHAEIIRHEFEPNEAAARDLLCRIVEAEYAYAEANGGFTNDASLLEGLPSLTSMSDDYNFILDADAARFSVWATPTYGVTGANGYFADQTRIIRYAVGADADALTSPFGEFCAANGAQISQNEVSARAILCQILEAEYVFYSEHAMFTADFGDLAGLPDLSIPVNGYYFILGSSSFGSTEVISRIAINATAEAYNTTGFNGFYVDERGDIRIEAGHDADVNSSLFGEACISENGLIARNELAAREILCRIFVAEDAFFQAYGVYTTRAAELSGLPDLSVPVEGYIFVLGGNPSNFTVNATAVVYEETGFNGYFTDSSGVLRFVTGADATLTSPEFGQLCPYLE